MYFLSKMKVVKKKKVLREEVLGIAMSGHEVEKWWNQKRARTQCSEKPIGGWIESLTQWVPQHGVECKKKSGNVGGNSSV